MKIRKGFVSNSSSSSFVVVSKDASTLDNQIPEDILKIYRPGWDRNIFNYVVEVPVKDSQMEFGWRFERYYGFGDKLNYAMAQMMRLEPDITEDYKEMLRNVLRKHTEHTNWLDLKIDYNYFYWDSISDDQCYVDHQSAYYEYKPEYHTIFKDEDTLEAFLFNKGSFIQCGNDNENSTREWKEAKAMANLEYGRLLESYVWYRVSSKDKTSILSDKTLAKIECCSVGNVEESEEDDDRYVVILKESDSDGLGDEITVYCGGSFEDCAKYLLDGYDILGEI